MADDIYSSPQKEPGTGQFEVNGRTAEAMGVKPETIDLPYKRGSDALANGRGQLISFMHVPSQTKIYFKAFITNYNETYNSDWTSEVVYGRADPIYLFKQTQRKIALSFKVPAASEGEAFDNLGRVQKLIQFLYPNYTTVLDPTTCDPIVAAQTVSQSPMVRLKIMNLVRDQKEFYKSVPAPDGDSANTYEKVVGVRAYTDSEGNPVAAQPSQGLAEDASGGLLGVIENVTVDHRLQDNEGGAFNEGSGVVLPKLIEINLAFAPIHEHPVGWREGSSAATADPFFNPLFPYGINLEGIKEDPSAAATTNGEPNTVENTENESFDAQSTNTSTTSPPMDDEDNTAGNANGAAAAIQTALELKIQECREAAGLPTTEDVAAVTEEVGALPGLGE